MVFGAIMLCLLWVFQVQLLDRFYVAIKTHSVKNAATNINSVIQNEETSLNYKECVDEIARKNDLCVSIIDDDFNEIYTSNRRDPRCMIDKMKQSEISSLYENAIANGGSASQLITTDENRMQWTSGVPNGTSPDVWKKGKGIQNMTYASVLKMTEDQSVVILVNAELTPVSATKETIRTQLIIITVVLLLLGMLLAWMMSKKIANPIIKINNSAKKLAKGEYEVTFEGKGYLEISELNNTLTYAAKELGKVQNLQRELIANMSHDLRTPLTMISGYGEMMRDIPGENTPENVQIIIDETNRLTNLVNDILDLSKLQSGVQSLQLTNCSITEMIRQLIDRYQKMLVSKEYHIEFIYDEDCYIQGDEIKLNQVIYNLMNNAMTYCGEDKTVIVKQRKLEAGVRIEIIDHGPGIPEDELPYVWERYYKTKQYHIRSTVGTGLGLSIVKNILDLHKATYGVESKLGAGTTFWIELSNEA